MNHIPESSLKVENGVISSPEVVSFEKFVSRENIKYSRVDYYSSLTDSLIL